MPEICVVCVNSGIFVTSQGTSSIYTGVLTKDLCLQTKSEKPIADLDTRSYERLVGGVLQNRGAGGIYAKVRRGAGSTGGAISGGGSTGGCFDISGGKEMGGSINMPESFGGKKGRHSKINKHLS